jgi:hypothetical protein
MVTQSFLLSTFYARVFDVDLINAAIVHRVYLVRKHRLARTFLPQTSEARGMLLAERSLFR